MSSQFDTVRAIEWQDDALKLLDQRRLPHEQITHTYHDAPAVAQAIHDMIVRGAPAIGIAGAYGAVLSARRHWQRNHAEWEPQWREDVELLANSRPTAVNLRWALNRMLACDLTGGDPVERLLAEAQAIQTEDYAANRRMGELALPFFTGKSSVITHCNTGSLATAGYGTALGVIRSAYAAGRIERVFAGETRPWLQGARLTAWELAQDGIPVCLMADGAGASRMAQGGISWVIVGADRITADGSVANKIGTYSLAVNARYHGVRFMVVAPYSTVDMSLTSGADIPIEQRSADEVLCLGGQRIAATGAEAWNPSFDVTPASLIDVIVTEKGVVEAPTIARMAAIFSS